MSRLDSQRSDDSRVRFVGAARGVALAVGAALLLAGCGNGSGPAPAASAAAAKPAANVPAKAAAGSAPGPGASAPAAAATSAAAVGALGVLGLLDAARAAYAQHHLVAPAGASAMDYYEAVLAKEPDNQVAKDSLREIFPFAVPDVEKSIAQNDYAEATREIGVMARADPTNYTLTLLRAKLDAQQKLQARQQQEAQTKAQHRASEQLAAAQQAATQQKAAAAQAERAAAATRLAEQQAQAQAEAAKVAAARAAAAKAAAAAPVKPAGVTRGAELVTAAAATYPVAAARNQTSGFVVVQFTVGTNGDVGDVQVVDSSPRRVFDSAAEQAIRRSRFKPALKDGEPVAAVLQRRIDFKFNQ